MTAWVEPIWRTGLPLRNVEVDERWLQSAKISMAALWRDPEISACVIVSGLMAMGALPPRTRCIGMYQDWQRARMIFVCVNTDWSVVPEGEIIPSLVVEMDPVRWKRVIADQHAQEIMA
jgi:hypothetical protein